MDGTAPLAQCVLWQRACGQEQVPPFKAFTTRHQAFTTFCCPPKAAAPFQLSFFFLNLRMFIKE